MRFRKRPIGDQRLAVAHAHTAGRSNRMQLRAADELAAGRKLLPELAVFPIDLLGFGLSVRGPLLFVLVNQHQVLHFFVSLVDFEFLAFIITTDEDCQIDIRLMNILTRHSGRIRATF